MNHDDNHAAALGAEETAARDTYDRLRLEYGALHRRFGTWVEAHEATAARVQAGEFSPFSREWFESVARFVKAAELDQASAPVTGWTVVSRQDGQAYANDPDHLTVGARRWPILWAHKATYAMGGRS